ncbi:hypothetical protein ACO0QE_000475 [Hanseniaspora vineae]
MTITKHSYGLSPFQNDLLSVLKDSQPNTPISEESVKETFNKFVFHPTLTVQHYIPRDLLLTTPLESLCYSSDCLHKFVKYLTETATTNNESVCVVAPSIQHLDLIERVLLSIPNESGETHETQIKRLSGLALLPEHTFHIPTSEELEMLQYIKKTKQDRLRLEEEDKRRIGKNKKKKRKIDLGSKNGNGTNTTRESSMKAYGNSCSPQSVLFNDIERLSYVTKYNYIMPSKENTSGTLVADRQQDKVFYLITATHLSNLGVSRCLMKSLQCGKVIFFENGSKIEYPSSVDVQVFAYNCVSAMPLSLSVNKDELLKYLKKMEADIVSVSSAIRKKQAHEFARQQEMDKLRQDTRAMFKDIWNNKLEKDVEASSKKVYRVEDDMSRLMKYYDEISTFKSNASTGNTESELEKEIETMRLQLQKQDDAIEELRLEYQKVSNEAMSSSGEFNSVERQLNFYKNKLKMLEEGMQETSFLEKEKTSLEKELSQMEDLNNSDTYGKFVQVFEKRMMDA